MDQPRSGMDMASAKTSRALGSRDGNSCRFRLENYEIL